MAEEQDEYKEYEEYLNSVNQRAGTGCLIAVLAIIVLILGWCIYSLFFTYPE